MPLSQRGVTPFFALACKRVSPAINHREWATNGKRKSEGKKRRKRSAVCTRVIRKRRPPRAAWALSSKNKQNVAPRHGLTRVYIARIADIAGRFSLVLSFSPAVMPFYLLLLSLLILPPSLSFSLQKKIRLVHVRARGEICCMFHANNSGIATRELNIALFTKAG